MSFLSIGHCCLDLAISDADKENIWVPGGSTTYGLRLASFFNMTSTLLTSVAADFDLSIFKEVNIINVATPHTTKFHNKETPQGRQQHIHSVATKLFPQALQEKYQDISMVHLCPIAQEVDISFLDYFSNETVICLSPQGWLRQWDEHGKVTHLDFNDYHLWRRANIVVLSREEIGNTNPVDIAKHFKYFILTKGREGAVLFHEGESYHFPIYPTKNVVDTTGAGDVFASAFLFKIVETKDPILAMKFATACASFCVEAEGINFQISEEELKRRIQH